MVDSSCSPLTLVRRTRSGNLILYADPIRKKLSSDLGRQTHFPFWNTSSPTVATLCYKEHHRFVFSVSYDERILGRNLDFFFLGRARTTKKWLQLHLMLFLFCFFWQNITYFRKPQVISAGGAGGCASPAPSPRSAPDYDMLFMRLLTWPVGESSPHLR